MLRPCSLKEARLLHASAILCKPVTRLKPRVSPSSEAGQKVADNPSAATKSPNAELTKEQVEFLTKQIGHPDDWTPVYRLRAMPFAQVRVHFHTWRICRPFRS